MNGDNLKKQVSRATITIERSQCTKEELREALATFCYYVRVCDGSGQLQAYIQLRKQKRLCEVGKLVRDASRCEPRI